MGRRQGGELTTPGARGITMCKLCLPCELLAVWETASLGCWGHWTLLILHNSQGTEAQNSCLQGKKLVSLAACCYRSDAAGRGSQIHQVVLECDMLNHVKSSGNVLQTLCY